MLTAVDIRQRINPRRAESWVADCPGDSVLASEPGAALWLKPAAVIIPLIDRQPGLTILLTRRTEHLSAHAGQVSFPGGRMEPSDQDAQMAALRETKEEIGLAPDRLEVVGRLATYVTGTGYEVVPFVALVRSPFVLTPEPTEVADVFEMPLAWLMCPDSCKTEYRDWKGAPRLFYVFEFDGKRIWGATAAMLVNLRDALADGR